MNQLVRSLMICELKARLNSCQLETRVLAKEIVYPNTPVLRRNEALMQRARLQTECVVLERRLAGLGIYTFNAEGFPERRGTLPLTANSVEASPDAPPFR